MSGYTRQSSSDLVPTAVVRSSPLNTEYNKIRDAFAFDATGVTGHKHDGSSDEGSYIPLIADLDALNKVEVDTGNNRVGFFVEVSSAAVEQVRLSDGLFVPVTTNDVDLGSATAKFKDLHLAGDANVAGDVNVTGALVGAVTGDITGNVTGDLTGNVTAGSGESSFTNVTINGTLDVTNTPITNVSDPTSAQEAATKNYVDTADALKLNLTGGTLSGELAMGTSKITGMGNPTLAQDAATKAYVDSEVSGLIDAAPGALDTLNELAAAIGDDAAFSTTITNSIATKLPLAGGTMSGAIAMGTSKITGLGNPTLAQDAATKTYVDTADALKLNLTGGTMSGAIAMGNSQITGLATPTTGTDATTKTYVDGILGSGEDATAAAAAALASELEAEAAEAAAEAARDLALAYRDSAAVSAALAAAEAAGITGYDLSAIADTIAATAVDVFVYDTTQDSDGGAWRNRCQQTSWYNETLNTATRGARQEFPVKALIVAEAAKVTIYDLDDPAVPMWNITQKSAGSGSTSFMRASSIVSVTAKNGMVAFGSTSDSDGFMWVDYLKSECVKIRNSAQAGSNTKATYLYSKRNDVDAGLFRFDPEEIVNTAVNDIAITTLPGAPIDDQTGLPVPTIAVGTDGGVSVIRDDGTVVDLNRTPSSSFDTVAFTNKGLVIGAAGTGAYWVYSTIPDVDTSLTPNNGQIEYYDPAFPNQDTPAFLGYVNMEVSGDAIGTALGLTNVAYYAPDPTKSMTAWTTADYATGWQHGDVKGAFLCEASEDDLTDTPLNANFDFASGATDWSDNLANMTYGTGTVTMSVLDIGTLFLTTGVTTLGETVTVRIVVDSISTGQVGPSFNTGAIAAGDEITSAGTYTYTKEVTSVARVYVRSENSDAVISEFAIIGCTQDRSVNGNGLAVNGTITVAPVETGAETMAYSGWSASNYLSQPYNSELPTGLQDFYLMTWVDTGAGTTSTSMCSRCTGGTAFSAETILWDLQSNMYLNFYTRSGDVNSVLTSTTSINNKGWVFVCSVVSESGTRLSHYINGALTDTGTFTGQNMSFTDEVFYVGARGDGSAPLSNGSLSRFRIGAGAPTPEQIKKIYRDELPLYREDAACTINGTSSAVTAMASDPVTGLLQVGTSGGLSAFRGLQRVEQDTTAVTTTISANGATVARQ